MSPYGNPLGGAGSFNLINFDLNYFCLVLSLYFVNGAQKGEEIVRVEHPFLFVNLTKETI